MLCQVPLPFQNAFLVVDVLRAVTQPQKRKSYFTVLSRHFSLQSQRWGFVFYQGHWHFLLKISSLRKVAHFLCACSLHSCFLFGCSESKGLNYIEEEDRAGDGGGGVEKPPLSLKWTQTGRQEVHRYWIAPDDTVSLSVSSPKENDRLGLQHADD